MNRVLPILIFAWSICSASSAPLTSERIKGLPVAERERWSAYFDRSQTLAISDQAALDTEVAELGWELAKKAPYGPDFKVKVAPQDVWYSSEEAQSLANVILSYQSPAGGWSKHTGYALGPRERGMQWTSQNDPGSSAHYLATFDNHSTTAQLAFLAYVWEATGREDCKLAFERGLEFVLAAQYPNGGWPQVYPLEGDYHDDITFNDDAMTHVLELLKDIVDGEPSFAFISEPLRARVQAAWKRGIQNVLNLQVVVAGRRTSWCNQYDPLTLEPTDARAMEPASLSGLESREILKLLMSIQNPNPEVKDSIEAALAWYDEAKIEGLSRVKRDGKPFYEADPQSEDVFWARFYDLNTGKPIFPGRDGVVYGTFEEMAANNKLGYDYYTKLPGSVVNNSQKKWRKMLSKIEASK